MWSRVLSLGLPGTVLLVGLVPACGETNETPRVAVVTNLAVPNGVLDHASKLTLTVLEGNVTCDDTLGRVALPGGPEAAKEIARRDLSAAGCVAPAHFCGDLTIEKSETPRVFSAMALGADDATVASGCATATVNQDALPIAIKMFRFLEPATCGDLVIQPTEQCEPGNTPICEADCTTKELLLSVGSALGGTLTGRSVDKTDPFLLWPQQSGTQGRFFAFYTDRAVTGTNNVEIALRALNADLTPITAGAPPALAAGSIYLSNDPKRFPALPAPRQQSAAQAAFLEGKYYVVFQDDTGTLSGLDIHLRSMDATLFADQGADSPLSINGPSGAGEPGIQSAPAIAAGPNARLFIAWEDAGAGKIVGRTLSPPTAVGAPPCGQPSSTCTLGNQNDISIANGSKGVSVAATSTGWVTVWQSGTDVKLRLVNEDGTPQGMEASVNESGSVTERPRVSSLPDGRFAVTWSSGGDIFVQRYDVSGAKIPGDQARPINDVVMAGEQTTPSIAGTSAAGGSYAVVWLDAASNNVQGRMLGGSAGFLFNSVNGQSTEFQASRSSMRVRANPVVVAGGAGPFVAIAWEDQSDPGAGIVVRRFPLPTE
jgi:hypothetical protein